MRIKLCRIYCIEEIRSSPMRPRCCHQGMVWRKLSRAAMPERLTSSGVIKVRLHSAAGQEWKDRRQDAPRAPGVGCSASAGSIDLDHRVVMKDQDRIKLPPKRYDVLACLARRVSHTDLLTATWGRGAVSSAWIPHPPRRSSASLIKWGNREEAVPLPAGQNRQPMPALAPTWFWVSKVAPALKTMEPSPRARE